MPAFDVPPPVPPRVLGSGGERGGTPYLPLRLERLSARELSRPPERFGIDTPYTATPTGWGEWIPVLPGEAADPIVVLAPPAVVVQPEDEVTTQAALVAQETGAEEVEAEAAEAEAAEREAEEIEAEEREAEEREAEEAERKAEEEEEP